MIQKISLEIERAKEEQAKKEQAIKPEDLLDMLYLGILTKKEVEQQLTGSMYARYRRQIEDVWAKRLQNLAAEWREKMVKQGKSVQVLWIYGSVCSPRFKHISIAPKGRQNLKNGNGGRLTIDIQSGPIRWIEPLSFRLLYLLNKQQIRTRPRWGTSSDYVAVVDANGLEPLTPCTSSLVLRF